MPWYPVEDPIFLSLQSASFVLSDHYANLVATLATISTMRQTLLSVLLIIWLMRTAGAISSRDGGQVARILRERQNDEPVILTTPPWYYPQSMSEVPSCAADSEACMGTSAQTASCTDEFCIESWF
jgi:hypothetical protein